MSIFALLPADPSAYVVPDGDPAEALHVTMLYLGSDGEDTTDVQVAAAEVLSDIAAAALPITATVSGVATLGDDLAVVLTLDSEALCALRCLTVDAMTTAGFPPVDSFPTFIPHMTLGYPAGLAVEETEDPDAPEPVLDPTSAIPLITAALPFTGQTIVFDRLALIDGDQILWQTVASPEEVIMPPTTDDAAEFASAPPPPSNATAPTPKPGQPADSGEPLADTPHPGASVLVGMTLTDPSQVTVTGTGLPFLAPAPYVALFEVPLADGQTAQAVADGLNGLTIDTVTTDVTRTMSRKNPDSSGLGFDPSAFSDVAAVVNDALATAGFAPADYSNVVQVGTADPSALVGTTIAFSGLIVVSDDGTTTDVTTTSTVPVDDPTSDPTVDAGTPVGEASLSNDRRLGAALARLGFTSPWRVNAVAITADAAPAVEQADAPFGTPTITADDGTGLPQWEGVLVIEGIPSGDGRMIQEGALTWRDLPLPLNVKTEVSEGHDNAQLAGRIDWIERREMGAIWGGGVLDTGSAAGAELARLMDPNLRMLRGVSIDLDNVAVAVSDDPDEDPLMGMLFGEELVVAEGRIIGACATTMPAFQEATIALLPGALAASITGDGCDCDRIEALVASAGLPSEGAQVRVWTPWPHNTAALVASPGGPVAPPAEWFARQTFTVATPVKVSAEGRISGHVAAWGSCHIGFADRCVGVPRSASNYGYYANKETLTQEGSMVATGPIMMDTVHPDLRLRASDAQAFYADTGSAVGDVAVFEDEHGIQIAGAIRPTATANQVRAFRGSDVSPDWRHIGGRYECVAMLAVNASGFVTRALAASAASAGNMSVAPGKVSAYIDMAVGEVLGLVAAGMVRHQTRTVALDRFEALETEFAAFRREMAPILAASRRERHEHAVHRLGQTTRKERRLAAVARLTRSEAS